MSRVPIEYKVASSIVQYYITTTRWQQCPGLTLVLDYILWYSTEFTVSVCIPNKRETVQLECKTTERAHKSL